jgi:hypothetical protein
MLKAAEYSVFEDVVRHEQANRAKLCDICCSGLPPEVGVAVLTSMQNNRPSNMQSRRKRVRADLQVLA